MLMRQDVVTVQQNYLPRKRISELALLNCKKKVEYDYKGLFSYRIYTAEGFFIVLVMVPNHHYSFDVS